MKMAKASDADLSMANELAGILDSLEKGWVPQKLEAQIEDGLFDQDDPEHLKAAMALILNTLEKGSLFRVVFGMAVLCAPENKCIDPDADTLEEHPDHVKDREQRDELLADAKRYRYLRDTKEWPREVCGALENISTAEMWDSTIDAAIAKATGSEA